MGFADIISRLGSIAQSVGFADIVDIAIISVIVYYVLSMFKKTRAYQLLTGVTVFFLVYILAQHFKLKALTFLIDNMLQVGLIALLVVFQPELRRALEQMGSMNILARNFLHRRTYEDAEIDRLRKSIAAICDGVERMSEKQTGALIVMEKFTRLETVKQSGTPVNADITPELIGTIFYDGSPLHDGAVVIHDGRITHAGCVLPLSDNLEISKEMGTRHRAALGISEVSDVIALVVSEETGTISYAKDGVLRRHQDRHLLYEMLTKEFIQPIVDAQEKNIQTGFLRRKNDEQ
ncbi:MAG: diadenylate cyclase CdaA [Oscillospiraceae bacterium]|nr:diadenylate cyclase CdaA [Oscillospiraceae bacterium]